MKISDEWSFYNLTLPFDDNCLSLTIYTHDKITNLFKEVNCDTIDKNKDCNSILFLSITEQINDVNNKKFIKKIIIS